MLLVILEAIEQVPNALAMYQGISNDYGLRNSSISNLILILCKHTAPRAISSLLV